VKKIAVFVSGNGSNFKCILEHISKSKIKAEVVCVVSNHSRPGAFLIAKKSNIPTHHVNVRQFKNGDEYTQYLLELLEKYNVDLVILAGFMKLIPAPVVRAFKNSIVNIHPALLPNFGGKGYYGMKVHEAVIKSGIKVTGVTVHFVDDRYDTGPIIIQKKVEVFPEDTAEVLAKRVLKLEHKVYPEVIKAICEDQIEVRGRKVVWHK